MLGLIHPNGIKSLLRFVKFSHTKRLLLDAAAWLLELIPWALILSLFGGLWWSTLQKGASEHFVLLDPKEILLQHMMEACCEFKSNNVTTWGIKVSSPQAHKYRAPRPIMDKLLHYFCYA